MISYLQIENLSKSFGDLVLFNDLSLGLSEGQRVGLIAKNGTGKTTLLNIIAGKEGYDGGNVTFRRDIKVGYLEQDPRIPENLTVLEACFHSDSEVVNVIAQYEAALRHNEIDNLSAIMERMDQLEAWNYEQQAKQILSQLKINNFDQRIGELSGGQLKRVAMANVLITEPDLLILDEPTNHLDLEMTEWLESYLNRSRMTLLMVTHDRYFLDRVCNEIIEIDNRQLYSYQGNYGYYLEKREERILSSSVEMERANNLMRTELEWMRRQPQARATKAKSRIDAFYELEQKTKQRRELSDVKLEVQSAYIGTKIFEARKVSKSYGDLKILEDYNYDFARYEKMGIVGNNGTGKSTFIKILMGEIAPDSGTIDVGETIRFGYYSQDGLQFDENMKVIDAVRDIAEEISLGDGRKLSASQFLQHFLFAPEKQHNFIYKLSGGEKRRLYMCTVLMRNPNFLVLDEPTNDLDIVTLNVLEEYLKAFKGCVIVVSHDRYFMDKVVDHLLVFRGDAQLKDFPGNYTDYRDWKEEQDRMEKERDAALQRKDEKVAPKIEKLAALPQRKLSYKEKRELEEIDVLIPKLEEERKRLEAELSSGALQSDELVAKSERIGSILDEIDQKTMRWLELSEL